MSLLLLAILMLQSEIPLAYGDEPVASAAAQAVFIFGWFFSFVGVCLLVTSLVLWLARRAFGSYLIMGILSVGLGAVILVDKYFLPVQDAFPVFAAFLPS